MAVSTIPSEHRRSVPPPRNTAVLEQPIPVDALSVLSPPSNPTVDYDHVVEKLTLNEIKQILNEKFIFVDDVAQAFFSALKTGENLILWGSRGHAKSEMVTHLLTRLGLSQDTKVLDCGVGLEESTLFGGLNFQKLARDKILDYNVEQSIFGHQIAVLEELLDAPPEILSALKNTLTSKKVQKGGIDYPIKTRLIICCTNRDPSEVADLGESFRALIDRFPLRINIAWPSYEAKDYLAMFKVRGVIPSPEIQKLTEIIAASGSQKVQISPRTAMKALAIAKVNCETAGKTIDMRSIAALIQLPELSSIAQKEATIWEAEMKK